MSIRWLVALLVLVESTMAFAPCTGDVVTKDGVQIAVPAGGGK